MTTPSIDPRAADALRSPAPVRLLLTCAGETQQVVRQLEAAGITVVDTIVELGIVVVEATGADRDALASLRGVESVELDGEERAL